MKQPFKKLYDERVPGILTQSVLCCIVFSRAWIYWLNILISFRVLSQTILSISSEIECAASQTFSFKTKDKTRQHSTQSVRNMPPPSPRHLLPHVLQILPRNPKYDQFQPKGHHNEENPQSTTKMPGNPKFYLFH